MQKKKIYICVCVQLFVPPAEFRTVKNHIYHFCSKTLSQGLGLKLVAGVRGLGLSGLGCRGLGFGVKGHRVWGLGV